MAEKKFLCIFNQSHLPEVDSRGEGAQKEFEFLFVSFIGGILLGTFSSLELEKG
jgi:hypothetical protein